MEEEIGKKETASQGVPAAAERISSLKYGKVYNLNALYLVDGTYVVTRQLLKDEEGVQPIGVIIPYKYQGIKMLLVVYYKDESGTLSILQASKYAKFALKPVRGTRWRLKSKDDDVRLKNYKAELNAMCKQMGGNGLSGRYYDQSDLKVKNPRNPNEVVYRKGSKIRYVCDVLIAQ